MTNIKGNNAYGILESHADQPPEEVLDVLAAVFFSEACGGVAEAHSRVDSTRL